MRQHHIPQCYLNAWCDPEYPSNQTPYVWVFDKNGSNPKKKAPKNLLYSNDLYTDLTAEGKSDPWLEKYFSKLESNFNRIRRDKLEHQLSPNSTEKEALLLFVATLFQRNPKFIDRLSKFLNDHLNRWKETPWTPPEVLKAFAERPIQRTIPWMIEDAYECLVKLNISILVTSDFPGFITSDNPVIHFDPRHHYNIPSPWGIGLGTSKIEISVPISPRQCLFLSKRLEPGYRNVPSAVVDDFNRRHIFHCSDQFIVNKNFTKLKRRN